MKVIKVTPRGYCKGVINAINIVKKTMETYPNQKIHLLGNIIHNDFVKKAIQQHSIIVHDTPFKSRLALLDEIDEGIVIFSAHGVSDEIRQKAIDKGLKIIDASCVDVLKTQQLIKNYLKEDYTIFYIGKINHPEAEAMIALDPNKIYLIHNKESIPQGVSGKTIITCQTTMSLYDVKELVSQIQLTYPDTAFMDEVCSATRMRQEAVMKLNKDEIDLLVIVGDRNSNNTSSLGKIAKQQGIKEVSIIESLNDLNPDILANIENVAVTAGASTPSYIVNMIIDYLEQYPNVNKKTVDYTKVL